MRLLLLIIALIAGLDLHQANAESCINTPRDEHRSADYELLSNWSAKDLQLLVDEYSYAQKFSQHQDALNGGFALGDVVYRQILTPGRSFGRNAVRSWKRAYLQSGHKEYTRRLKPMLRGRNLDQTLVAVAQDSCLRAPASGEVQAIDNCRFNFSAGLRPESEGLSVAPSRLTIVGGRCAPWPSRGLISRGHSVRCERSGNGGVMVTLGLTRGEPVQTMLPPLRVRKVPDEPVLEERTRPQVEVLSLYRSRDYRVVEHGRSCPTCRLYAADVRPSLPGATILAIGVASGGFSSWLRCPAGLRCGTYEFSPPDHRNVSSCAGQVSCRVWRLAEGDGEGYDTIQLTYEVREQVCRNCPRGVTFEEAHKRWERARQEAENPCEVFPDPPPQAIKVGTPR